ncbi:MAG: InlB B-repeat-containing protein [Christensenellaceae bacterium]
MKRTLNRIFALFLVLCLIIPLVPVKAQAPFRFIKQSDLINGIFQIDGKPLIINGHSIPVNYKYGNKETTLINGEKFAGENGHGCWHGKYNTQCWGFATFITDLLYGYVDYGGHSDSVPQVPQNGTEVLVLEKGWDLKQTFYNDKKIKPGAHVRMFNGKNRRHSFIYLGSNDQYFWTYESGDWNGRGNADRNEVQIIERDWIHAKKYIDSYGGILYITQPKEALDTTASGKYKYVGDSGREEVFRETNTNSGYMCLIKNTSVNVMGKVSANQVEWYKIVGGGYVRVGQNFRRIGELESTIDYSSMKIPLGDRKLGVRFIFSGKISSPISPINSVTCKVINATTGATVAQVTDYPNTTEYSFKSGGRIDMGIPIRTLGAGTYYVQYTAKNASGLSKCYPETPQTFNIGSPAQSVVASPQITYSSILGGKEALITCNDKNATISYRLNGGELVTLAVGESATLLFKEKGSYSITAYSNRAGYTKSAEITRSMNVECSEAPVVWDLEYDTTGAVVLLSASGQVYYTTDNSVPSLTSTTAECSTTFHIEKNTTVKAFSIEIGKTASAISEKNIVVTSPDSPKVMLYETCKPVIAIGDTTTVFWDADPMATEYSATLYDGQGKAVETKPVMEVFIQEFTDGSKTKTWMHASFLSKAGGDFTIKAKSKNFFGESPESTAVAIKVMPDVTAKFVDWDNATIEEQKIRYGASPTAPKIPSRTGYSFSGWSKLATTPLLEDTVFTATYSINTYTVKFFESNGTLLSTERINYLCTANPPVDKLKIPVGYALAGWCVENGSDCLDYSSVTGNMSLTASYQWGNKDLPVKVAVTKATYSASSKGPVYSVTVNLKNNNIDITRGRLVVAIKTSDNRTIDTVVSDYTLPVEAMDAAGAAITLSVNSKEIGTIAEAYFLGVDADNDDKTGGAYSAIATQQIDQEIKYSEFTEWSTTEPSTDAAVIETTTKYKYRTKDTTTSQNNTLDGWTQIGEPTLTYGGWGAWQTTPITASDTCEVESVNVNSTLLTQRRYGRYEYNKRSNGAVWTNFCPTCSKQDARYGVINQVWSPWISDSATPVAGWSQRCGHVGGFNVYKYIINGCVYYANPDYGFLFQTQTTGTGAHTEYRSRSISKTYNFFKWNDWSAETELKPENYGLAYDEYDTITYHRYRTKLTNGDMKESTTTEQPNILTGTLTANGIGTFDNKKATVLVYKKANTDPTQSQLEYVGQTTIGAGNSYNISFKTKEQPNAVETGDFIISFAIEGASRLVNVGVIEAPISQFDVIFEANNVVVSEQKINEGANAAIPPIPSCPGMTFAGWSESTANITQNMTIKAVFVPAVYTITFVDWVNGTLTNVKRTHGQSILPNEAAGTTTDVPPVQDAIGRKFLGWDAILNNELVATSDMVLTAKWETDKYTVKFADAKGGVIEKYTQQVSFGGTAQLPTDKLDVGEDYFVGWSNSVEWWCVTNDITVFPIVLSKKTVVPPVASVKEGKLEDAELLNLFPTEDGATVYVYFGEGLTMETAKDFLGIGEGNAASAAAEQGLALSATQNDAIPLENPEETIPIVEYTDPILINDNITISTFQKNADGKLSDIAVYKFNYETLEENTEKPIAGDVNMDRVLDTVDVTRLLRFLVGDNVPISFISSDATADKRLDVTDVLRLMKFLAGWTTTIG